MLNKYQLPLLLSSSWSLFSFIFQGRTDQFQRVFPCRCSFSFSYKLTIEIPYIKCPDPWNDAGLCTFKNLTYGFPGGSVVENLPANAGDTGSSPGLGRSHMPRSNWARAPQLLSLCSATREAAIVRGLRTAMKSGPRLPQLEKALAQKRRPNTAIN